MNKKKPESIPFYVYSGNYALCQWFLIGPQWSVHFSISFSFHISLSFPHNSIQSRIILALFVYVCKHVYVNCSRILLWIHFPPTFNHQHQLSLLSIIVYTIFIPFSQHQQLQHQTEWKDQQNLVKNGEIPYVLTIKCWHLRCGFLISYAANYKNLTNMKQKYFVLHLKKTIFRFVSVRVRVCLCVCVFAPFHFSRIFCIFNFSNS